MKCTEERREGTTLWCCVTGARGRVNVQKMNEFGVDMSGLLLVDVQLRAPARDGGSVAGRPWMAPRSRIGRNTPATTQPRDRVDHSLQSTGNMSSLQLAIGKHNSANSLSCHLD